MANSRYTNLDYLKEITGGEPEVTKEFIEMFFDQLIEFRTGMTTYLADKKWKELDSLFFRRFLAGEITLISIGLLFFIIYFISAAYFPIIDRLTSLSNLVILFIAWGIMYLINSMAYYLRAHKEDPFYYALFLSSLYIVIVTYFCSRYLAVEFVFTGVISAYILFLPWFLNIFIKHIKYWHK